MSAGKNSILNYFKKTPGPATPSTPTSGPSTPSSQPAKKPTPPPKKPLRYESSSEEEEEEVVVRLPKSKVTASGDGASSVKRKRIRVMSSSSSDDGGDKDYCESPKLKGKKKQSPAKKTPKSVKRRSPSPSSNESSPNSEKENTANQATPKIKSRLSEFASPAIKKSKIEDEDDEPREDDGNDESACAPTSYVHLNYPFLDPKNIRDKNKRRPDEEDYDPTTLFVPDSFLKEQTPGQRQWWDLKREHFDTVLFFKMGKFYELFHMDAALAVQKCNLLLMKKEIAHCGFPEAAFQRYAEILVDLGYKVARIEQTETPAQMAERCAKMSRPTKFDKVVNREVCQVSSQGTRTLSSQAESHFLTAICPEKSGGKIRIGVAFVDTSIGTIFIGHFDDDSNLSRLETLLSVNPPIEILFDKQKTFPTLTHIVEKMCPNNSRGTSFPQVKKVLKLLADKDYFETRGKTAFEAWPKDLVAHLDEGDTLGQTAKPESELAIMALGALANYLQESLIDQYIFSLKKIQNVNPIDVERNLSNESDPPPGSTMILDQKSLKNLDIISTGGQASLFTVLDKTSTAMGKRLLHTWTCMPLLRIDEIEDRQMALKFLNGQPKMVEDIRTALKGIPDIEKLMSAIHTAGVKLPSSHPESRAVYYEQATYAKTKISRLVTCLEGLTTFETLIDTIQDVLQESPSKILKNLLLQENGGNFPNLSSDLSFFRKAFNQKEALTVGKIIPKRGVDEDYDRVQEAKSEFQDEIATYLKSQKKFFSADVKFFGNGNQAFQIEVPETSASRVNDEYTLSSQRKGFKRYTTSETKDIFAKNQNLEEEEAAALAEVSRNIFCKFGDKKNLWDAAVQAIAQLDALVSLHDYSFGLDDEGSCFAKFIAISRDEKPFLKIESGRHPIVIATNSSLSFIPNDFQLDDRLAILTGANMGGKSTLMRQTALLCVLAQMGCRVPAAAMKLSPIDRIFTRIGAADNIFDRESTFMVELSETSVILKHANRHSLVLIDELGRGTTTFDGCAIAHGVSKLLSKRGCRTIFSTHYHELMTEYVKQPNIAIYHMSVIEEEEEEDTEKAIVFLYTVSQGPCSKSHGFNAARLAGLPAPIIDRALKVASEFEEEQNNLLDLANILNQ